MTMNPADTSSAADIATSATDAADSPSGFDAAPTGPATPHASTATPHASTAPAAGHGCSRGPLSGVRVLDASTMLAGPYTAGLLADFGADVIKVEDLVGDPMRLVSSSPDGRSVLSQISNRNKRSIALDLRTEQGQELFRQMAQQVDVVATNFRMSTLQRWGLDYERLAADHPALVMYHFSAFGRSGPRKDDPGFARAAEAYSGLTYTTGEPDGPPLFSGYPIADGVGGVHGAFAVMLALYEVARTGKGQLVELSLAGSMIRMLETHIAVYGATGVSPERSGNRNNIVPNGLYRTSDDHWIAIPASSPNMWPRLCQALGLDHLIDDPRFVTNAHRLDHREELEAVLGPTIAALPQTEVIDRLRTGGVAVSPVNSMEDLFADPAAWESDMLIRVPDERFGGTVAMPGVFPQLSATPGVVHKPGPEPGEHTIEVLEELLDLSEAEIAAYRDANVVGVYEDPARESR